MERMVAIVTGTRRPVEQQRKVIVYGSAHVGCFGFPNKRLVKLLKHRTTLLPQPEPGSSKYCSYCPERSVLQPHDMRTPGQKRDARDAPKRLYLDEETFQQAKRVAKAAVAEVRGRKRAGEDVEAELKAALATKRALYGPPPQKRLRRDWDASGYSYVVRDCPACGRILNRDDNAARSLGYMALARLYPPDGDRKTEAAAAQGVAAACKGHERVVAGSAAVDDDWNGDEDWQELADEELMVLLGVGESDFDE
jgi:hypothetical protein